MTLINALQTRNVGEAFRYLRNTSITMQEINAAFQQACELGYEEFVDLFLKDSRVDPSLPSIQAIDYGISRSIEITRSFGLQQAAYYGHHHIVSMLLQDGRSDPSVGNYRCLTLIKDKSKTSYSHQDILRQLINYCAENGLDYEAAYDRSGNSLNYHTSW